MSNLLNKFINNEIDTERYEKFAVIIGENPSKNARSPILWNAAFKKKKLNYFMFPVDVSKNRLIDVLNLLKENKKFIGGSVTIPYKIDVAKWLDNNLTNEAKNIGAINSIYKNNNEILMGTNTDGEASLVAFKKNFGKVDKKKILILGCGGAGKAVAAYFSSELSQGYIFLSSRKEVDPSYLSQLKNATWIDWKSKMRVLKEIDIIINCTSIGFNKQNNMTPLFESDFKIMKKECIIYDIIYNPIKTQFLKIAERHGFKIFNGLEMNLLQAVLAFNHTVKIESNNTEEAMREIISN